MSLKLKYDLHLCPSKNDAIRAVGLKAAIKKPVTRAGILQASVCFSGLIKWSTREPRCDRFEQILEDHLKPNCDETGLGWSQIDRRGFFQTFALNALWMFRKTEVCVPKTLSELMT
jgi:hypothetical protein